MNRLNQLWIDLVVWINRYQSRIRRKTDARDTF